MRRESLKMAGSGLAAPLFKVSPIGRQDYSYGATAIITQGITGYKRNVFYATGLNDHRVFDDAYDYCLARGGYIWVEAGTYNVINLKNWTKPIWLVGPGPDICKINTTVAASGIVLSMNNGGSQIEFGGGVQGIGFMDTVGGGGRKCIYVEDTEHFVIRGCWVDNYGTGAHITGESYLNTIEHNQFKRLDSTGILVDSGITGMLIAHNRILVANGAARNLDFAGDNSTIRDNYIEQGVGATTTDCIRLNSTADRNVIEANIFDMNGTVTNTILVVAGATDNHIVHNTNVIYPSAAAAISDAGTRTIIRFNDGYITEAAGASTGTGVQQTIAHGLSFTPTRQRIALIAGSATANPYHSAAPDATNIYVTAALNQAWYWAIVG